MDNAFLDNAQQIVMNVLRAAEPELMAAYGAVDYETKADKTIVTELDKKLEEILRTALRPLESSFGILGEEFGQEGNQTNYWLVDPIDGTESFTRGIPNCKNLLCLVLDGKPVWALAYYFARNELWTARSGQGTFCNDQKITMTYRPMERCWFELSGKIHEPHNAALLAELKKHIAGFAMMHDSSNVVSGKVDGIVSFESGGGPWDYAPRALLYQEAGAKITNIGTATYDFHSGNYLVAHPKNFDQLAAFIV